MLARCDITKGIPFCARFAHSMNACTFVYSNNNKKQHDISSLLTPTTTVVIDFKLYINYIASCSISSARFKATTRNPRPLSFDYLLSTWCMDRCHSLSIFKHSTKLYLHSLIWVFFANLSAISFFVFIIYTICVRIKTTHDIIIIVVAPNISNPTKKKLAYYWRTFKSHLNNIQVWKQTRRTH